MSGEVKNEAPAEAGERDGAFCEAYYEEHLNEAWAALREGRPYQVNADGAICLIQQAASDRRALRSQPQAREDAQPVAWRRALSPIDGHFTYSNVGDDGWQPLYTHPAPDALRGALQESRDAVEFFDRVKAATPDEQIAVGRDHWTRMEAALRRLAALQAEQKGGV